MQLLLMQYNSKLCVLYYTVCPVNNQKFLSIDRDLLPINNVRATSEDTLFNPTENFITSSAESNPPWCSAINIGDINPQDHFVEVNFTEPVVITLLESSGLVNGYVNNFMIEYVSLDDPNEVHLYGVTELPQVNLHLMCMHSRIMNNHELGI